MSFTHLQGTSSSTVTSGKIVITLGAAPTTGNIVCIAILTTLSITVTGVADSNSNTYTKSTSSPVNVDINLSIYYLLNAPSNASATINATITGGSSGVAWADEFTVTSGPALFDKDASQTPAGTSGTTINLPTISTAYQNSLLYALCYAPNATITAPTSGATLGVWTGSAGAINLGAVEYDLSATGLVAVNYSLSGSSTYGGIMAAFYLTGASPTPGPVYLSMVGGFRIN